MESILKLSTATLKYLHFINVIDTDVYENQALEKMHCEAVNLLIQTELGLDFEIDTMFDIS